jgi:hypothetical protein
MDKKRKTHSPQFKAKVALAAIQNDEMTSLSILTKNCTDFTEIKVYHPASSG